MNNSVKIVHQPTKVVVEDKAVQVVTGGRQGPPGAQGPNGEGVPAGGTEGQVLAKVSATDFDTHWEKKSKWELLETQVVTEAVTAVEFNDLLDLTAYRRIKFVIQGITVAESSSPWLAVRLSDDNGATWLTKGNCTWREMKLLSTSVNLDQNRDTGLDFWKVGQQAALEDSRYKNVTELEITGHLATPNCFGRYFSHEPSIVRYSFFVNLFNPGLDHPALISALQFFSYYTPGGTLTEIDFTAGTFQLYGET